MKILAPLLVVATLVSPLGAQDSLPLSPREVVAAQLEAFRADDGARAYSFAADSVKASFTDPETFMTMVKRGYEPVYRARDYVFGRTADTLEGRAVELLLTGPNGRDWTAVYTLEESEDGWRITGCFLKPGGGSPA